LHTSDRQNSEKGWQARNAETAGVCHDQYQVIPDIDQYATSRLLRRISGSGAPNRKPRNSPIRQQFFYERQEKIFGNQEDMMRVLLVENDREMGQNLFNALQSADYTVDWVDHGQAGADALGNTSYGAALISLGLPGMCGIDLLKTARAAGNAVPVLLLSAHADPGMRAHGLDTGADDFVLKPCNARELLARIRAVLRRTAGYATARLGDKSIGLDLDKRTFFYNGSESALSAREFLLMHAFLERRGTVLSRGQLEERLYGWAKEVESNAVDVLIHGMRKRYGQSLIRNVRGMGWTVMPGESSGAAAGPGAAFQPAH
jgi:two-component system, OmpR family, response regulator